LPCPSPRRRRCRAARSITIAIASPGLSLLTNSHWTVTDDASAAVLPSLLLLLLQVICTEPHVYCKVFEDNSGALELARLPKLHPRTKHVNVCYHHFCDLVRKGLIKIFPIDTKEQIADTLTKALAQNDFNIIVATCVASNLHK
jgi:hypothetical protein